VSLSADAAEIGRLCLRSTDESLCAQVDWQASGALTASGDLSGLVLARLEPWLPGGARVDGRVDARFSVGGTTARPVVDAVLLPRDGQVTLETDEGPLELGYRDARLALEAADERITLTLGLRATADARVNGRLVAGAPGPAGRPLDGELDAVFPDLGLLAGFVPALSDVEGGFRVDMRVGGTDRSPDLAGSLRIEDARAAVVPAGIVLEDIDLSLDGDGDGPLRLRGSLRSGEGELRLSGRVTPSGATPALDLRIEGEDFQAVRLPEALVTLSPDIRIEGQDGYRVSGTVRVPRAQIELKSLPKGVAGVSPDEVIVGESTGNGATAVPVSGSVRVELGDEVSFEGFGLQTGLAGAIDARFDGQSDTVHGKIELRDGAYKAYGQDLQIEQGRLLFAGPPDRPNVDLRAVRVSRDGRVRAYLELAGPLQEPLTRIYSEPDLSQGEALAYLVTGRGLDQARGGEGVDLANAALALGVARGEPWLAQLSDRVGLDELRVETGETLEESSLLLGKYLTPDLYVGYTQELFNPEGALLLRLRLSERLEVETRSGRHQSVDLFYRYEHD
jgi:translocation and assembly module TamB